MKRTLSWAVVALVVLAKGPWGAAFAGERALIRRNAVECPPMVAWHGDYYNTKWGVPVVQLVPPTAAHQTHWGWGVGNVRITPIYPQFERNYPGPFEPRAGFLPTPVWPSDTDQFGVYYVRGPW